MISSPHFYALAYADNDPWESSKEKKKRLCSDLQPISKENSN